MGIATEVCPCGYTGSVGDNYRTCAPCSSQAIGDGAAGVTLGSGIVICFLAVTAIAIYYLYCKTLVKTTRLKTGNMEELPNDDDASLDLSATVGNAQLGVSLNVSVQL